MWSRYMCLYVLILTALCAVVQASSLPSTKVFVEIAVGGLHCHTKRIQWKENVCLHVGWHLIFFLCIPSLLTCLTHNPRWSFKNHLTWLFFTWQMHWEVGNRYGQTTQSSASASQWVWVHSLCETVLLWLTYKQYMCHSQQTAVDITCPHMH